MNKRDKVDILAVKLWGIYFEAKLRGGSGKAWRAVAAEVIRMVQAGNKKERHGVN